jgi:N6-adenosine-specific RNA methylase IME4
MPLERIKALRVGDLAAKNCLLWRWATHPMIDQQIDVLRAWGFRFVTSGVWVKRTKNGKLGFGTGYRLRSASEPFLIGINGNPQTAPTVRTVIEGPIRRHSEKPDEAYAEAQKLLPDARRADLFSRTNRPGWTAWGDEVGKFDAVAA